MKVVKFGGSSLASAQQLEKVKNIIAADKDRRVVVVSAPGKREDTDTKVTDLLIELASKCLNQQNDTSYLFNKIINRYREMALDLDMDLVIIDTLRAQLNNLMIPDNKETAYFIDGLKAFGEDANAQFLATYLNTAGIPARYVNPKAAGIFLADIPGNAYVLSETYANLYALRQYEEIVIIPGFFGFTKSDKLVTFSRGGSDITGAIVANGVKADLYENFTDVSAIYAASPAAVANPKPIAQLTYAEMRELSYSGFTVIHDEALRPAFAENIPVIIKNTNEPQAPGTLITRTKPADENEVTGIASSSGFASIYISKYLMNREVAFIRKVLSVLERYEVSIEHIVSGIDDIDVLFKEDQVSKKEMEKMMEEIRIETAAEVVKKRDSVALLMIVGEGMREAVGVTARAARALSEAHINIELINQGSSELGIMFGIKEEVEHKAIRAIYNAFYQ